MITAIDGHAQDIDVMRECVAELFELDRAAPVRRSSDSDSTQRQRRLVRRGVVTPDTYQGLSPPALRVPTS